MSVLTLANSTLDAAQLPWADFARRRSTQGQNARFVLYSADLTAADLRGADLSDGVLRLTEVAKEHDPRKGMSPDLIRWVGSGFRKRSNAAWSVSINIAARRICTAT